MTTTSDVPVPSDLNTAFPAAAARFMGFVSTMSR